MNAYQGTYKVTNKDWQQSLPQIFNTFAEALEAQQGWDTMASIEQINGESVDVVWQPDYEKFVSNVYFS
jgi:hypothetical protein